MTQKLPDLGKFWARVDIRGEDECWPWTGATNQDGYGIVHTARQEDGRETTMRAHIVSWAVDRNRRPESAMKICHSCDNPPCCNPEHLWEGTHQENIDDMVSKGRRIGKNSGEIHGLAKLTDARVYEMRLLHIVHKVKLVDIARWYEVAGTTAANAISGKTWGHVRMPRNYLKRARRTI